MNKGTYHERKKAGICTRCGKRKPRQGLLTCKSCGEISRVAIRKCEEKSAESRSLKAKNKRKERRENSLCVKCGKKNKTPEFMKCAKCRKYCREYGKGYGKGWREDNPEKQKKYARESHKRQRAANLEFFKARESASVRLWRKRHPEEAKRRDRERNAAHPEKNRAHARNRQLAKENRTPPWAKRMMVEFLPKMIKRRDELTKLTGIRHVIDHQIPLRGKLVSGLHIPINLRITTFKENAEKGNKFEPLKITYGSPDPVKV